LGIISIPIISGHFITYGLLSPAFKPHKGNEYYTETFPHAISQLKYYFCYPLTPFVSAMLYP